MKNVLKFTGTLSLTLMLFTLVTAFTSETTTSSSNNSCTVTVKYNSGSPAKSIKVSTYVSGGVSCVGGRDFYTDQYGQVTLKWSKGCYLKKVYAKGKGYDVNYRDGQSYTLSIK